MGWEKMWVLIPDTLLSEAGHLREKTVKLGQVARACALMGVQEIVVYRDETGNEEAALMKSILEYLETPQYLRRRIYGRIPALRYAGVLPPLRTPHHKPAKDLSEIRIGEYREGFVEKIHGRLVADVGLSQPVPVEGYAQPGVRVTVKFTSSHPEFRCRVVEREETGEYWGYRVKLAGTLGKLVRSMNADMVIFTSRKGRSIAELWGQMASDLKRSRSVAVTFGSPTAGVFEILSKEGRDPYELSKYVVNMFPDQGVATVRTEEAILGALSILNVLRSLS